MPINDFEGQVQMGLENLKLNPSGEVWIKVEEQIKKDKKRRGIILLLSLLTFLLVGGSFYFLTEKNKKRSAGSVH